MSKDAVVIVEVPIEDEHRAQKWLVIEGQYPGCPQVTKRVTINTFALASGAVVLEEVEDKLKDTVAEYKARWDAVTAARENRGKPKDPKDKGT